MSTHPGPRPAPAATHRPTEREGRIRTCVPARVTPRERRARAGHERQETADQEWNVVRGED
ncbi:hypothetical protein ACWC0A_06780 [Streptomyces scopuliridis]|uniref:hypothetical protein n=1 Tax=Streptomyces sp. NPDC057539 TaxID=3346159 RepID=UPI00368A32DC